MVGSSELDSDNDGAVFREGHFDAHKRVESSARRLGELPERLLHALSLRLDPDSSSLQSRKLICFFLKNSCILMQNCRQRRELHQFLRNPILTIFILQVSTISVYGYFAFALIGRQFPSMNENREMVDMYEFSPFKIFKPTIFSYFPIFTVLQFLFYGIFYFWIVFQLLIDHL